MYSSFGLNRNRMGDFSIMKQLQISAETAVKLAEQLKVPL